MSNKKTIGKNLLLILCILFSFTIFTSTTSLARDTNPPTGFTNIQKAPGINLVNGTGSTIEIDGDYSFNMNLFSPNEYSDGTSYVPFGEYSVEKIDPLTKSKAYTFDNSSGEKWVLIKNGAFYQGRPIDVKFVIDKLNFKRSGSLFRFFAIDPSERAGKTPLTTNKRFLTISVTWEEVYMMIGSALDVNVAGKSGSGIKKSFAVGDTVDYHYEFFEAGTNTPVDLKGVWNFTNINFVKRLTLPYPTAGFTDMYSMSNSLIDYQLKNDSVIFTTGYSTANGTTINQYPEYTQLSMKFTGQSLSSSIETMKYINSITETAMSIRYTTRSIARIAPATPIVLGNKNTATHEDVDKYKNLQYRILLTTGNNVLENRTDAFSIESAVPDYYSIDLSQLTITDILTGQEYDKSLYEPSLSADKSKLTIKIKDPKSDAFNGKSFYVNVSAKTNDKFVFSPNKYGYLDEEGNEDNGYMHFELAESTKVTYTHNNSKTTNKVINSKKIDETSIAKVNYQGVPMGEAKTGLSLDYGKQITDVYPTVANLLEADFETAIDTENLAMDTPVMAAVIGDLPDTSKLLPDSIVKVPIRLTSKQGLTKEVMATLKIVTSVATLAVEFRNEENELLSTLNIESLSVGDQVDLTKNDAVINELNKYTAGGGYSLIERPTEQFQLNESSKTVVYKLKGNLYIASAPEVFDFGTWEKKMKDLEVKQATNLDTEAPLKIVDNRGNKAGGWHITLKSIKEFKSGDQEISGAMIYRTSSKDSFTVTSSANSAYESKKGGDYVISGDWNNEGPGLGIKIKANDVRKTGDYTSEIEWELIAGQP